MSDTSCALISYLSKKTKKYSKCVISGDGADELFWGYSRYQKYLTLDKFSKFIPFKKILSEISNGSKLWKISNSNAIESYFRYSNAQMEFWIIKRLIGTQI